MLACLLLQYVHGMCTQLVYRFHVPAVQRLPDLGFALTPVRCNPCRTFVLPAPRCLQDVLAPDACYHRRGILRMQRLFRLDFVRVL